MSIYRANDIRGTYGTELRDRDAYRLGNAFVRFTKSHTIIVGRDNRLSSPALHKALIRGIIDAGANVCDVGEIDSPGFYFATSHIELPGIMITASHNPAYDNGFYVCAAHAYPINEQTGLKRIQKLAATVHKAHEKGTLFQTNIQDIYEKHVTSFVHAINKPIKVVIDAGNGMGAGIAIRAFKHLPQVHVTPLYFQSDGHYPHHGPDPAKPENLHDLGKKVRTMRAHFGIAFDGDADRAGFVDEHGEPVEGSLIGALIAQHLLKKHKHAKIVYSSTCSRILPETIADAKGKPLRDRVGHSFIKLRMHQERALLGIENTGHFMYRDNDNADSGIITALLVCEIFAQQKKPMSELILPFRKYYKTPEHNIKTTQPERILKHLRAYIKSQKPKKINLDDGIAADFGPYWISIRASHTEPLIRIIVEGLDKALVEKKIEEYENLARNG